ncbi:MAG: hypothetical protein MRY79_07635 [Alphaproteobacteria bacterium]|nr:hypothetical protein [Alphaproteobacteria bacterium]
MIDKLKNFEWGTVLGIIYVVIGFATFLYLSFFDDYEYTWWNWIIVLPINFFLGQIWPIYWIIIKPIFG